MTRQIYLSPRVGKYGARMASWALHEVVTSPDHAPRWTMLSSGSPSLVRLIPDALQVFEEFEEAGVSLTLTTRAVGPDADFPLADAAEFADLMVPDRAVSLCAPVGLEQSDTWTWAHRPAGRPFSIGGVASRFKRASLRLTIASVFNDQRTSSEEIDPASPFLREMTNLRAEYELWIRPAWRAAAMFPDAFPAPVVRPPVVMPAGVANELHWIEQKRQKQERSDKDRKAQEAQAAHNEQWRKDREARLRRELEGR